MNKNTNVLMELKESNNFYENVLFNNVNEMIQVCLPDGRIQRVNQKWVNIMEYSREEAQGMKVSDIIDPDHKKECRKLFNTVIKGNHSDKHRTVFRNKKNEMIDVEVTLSPIYSDGELVFIISIIRDVRMQKHIEKKLQEALRINEQILSNIPVGIILVDKKKNVIMMNKHATMITGYKEKELIGKQCNDSICINMRNSYPALDLHQTVNSFNEIIINKAGEKVPVLKTVLSIQIDNEEVRLEALTDMSEQVKIEEKLRKSEENYRAIFNNLHDIYFRTDITGKILMLSPSVEKITGYKKKEVIGKNASIFYKSSDNSKNVLNILIKRRYVENFEMEMLSKEGKVLYMIANAHLVNNGKNDKYVEGTFSDITHLKEIEHELRYSKRKQALHFQNTPLAVIEWDTDLNITNWNPAAEKMFGYKSNYALGKRIIDLIIPDYLKNEICDFENKLLGKKVDSNVNENITKEGKIITCEWYNTPLTDDAGKIIGVASAGIDITDRIKMEKDIRNLSKSVEQSPTTIILTDIEGNIEYVNPKFTEMTGYESEEVLGQNPRILKAGNKTEAEYKELWDTIKSGNIWKGEFQNKRKDGTLFWESASISPIKDKKGIVTHFVGVKEDITAKKHNEKMLIEAHKKMKNINHELMKNIDIANQFALKAEIANSAKSQFLANMSHEIRTPMNGIIGMTSLLLGTNLNREQKEYAEIIENSSESLLTIINDILDFSKIEAGKIELENINYNVRIALEDMNDIIALRAEEKDIEYTYFIDNKISEFVNGDSGRLKQVLINLIGNAIKFTKEGFVELLVEKVNEEHSNQVIRFSVKDTGIGISAKKIGKIFESFTQADASTTRQFGGTGLGLSISKQLVELMGGELKVQSVQGKGSTFWFDIILNKVKSENKEISDVITDIEGIRILHVDDNSTNRRLISAILNKWNIEYMEASDGKSALRILRQEYLMGRKFDIILTDMIMPEMDGIMLAQKIRDEFSDKNHLIVLMTSITISSKRERISEMGFDALINKPIKQNVLIDTIRRLRCNDENIEDKIETKEIHKPIKSANILLVEDNITNQKVASIIIKKMGFNVVCVNNGQEALDALSKTFYDVVLMDLQMPVMDGYKASMNIRNNMGLTIPIIAMSADVMSGTKDACMKAGMNDYISKPVKPNELYNIILRWTDKFENNNVLDLNIKELKEMLGGSVEYISELITVFISETIEIAESIEKNIEIENYDTIKKQAHKLKGASSSVCADKINEIAIIIETNAKMQNLAMLKYQKDKLTDAIKNLKIQTKEEIWKK